MFDLTTDEALRLDFLARENSPPACDYSPSQIRPLIEKKMVTIDETSSSHRIRLTLAGWDWYERRNTVHYA